MIQRLLLSLFCGAAAVLFMNSSNGAGASQNADRTGSPVSSGTCNNCHSGGAVTPTLTVGLFDGLLPVTVYTPGKSYTLRISLLGLGYSRFGFQAVALGAGNVNAGSLTASGTNTRVLTLNNRVYGEHTSPSNTGLFELNWKAPEPGAGTVTFYTAGLGAANPVGDNGDKGNTKSFSILEGASMDATTPVQSSLTFGPNPVRATLYFFNSPLRQISIFNMKGELVFQHEAATNALNLELLPQGVYLLSGSDGSGTSHHLRFIKA
ncbi:MAG: hypothetical protein RLZZ370_1834 [Bacteroidota bacterium]|jgi:hypothetical protein